MAGIIFNLIWVAAGLLCLGVYVVWLYQMSNTIQRISSANRTMLPGRVWLGLIPVFGLVWNFIIINAVADSLDAEIRQRNIIARNGSSSRGTGISAAVLMCTLVLPWIGTLLSIVCMIFFLLHINAVSETLKAISAAATFNYEEAFRYSNSVHQTSGEEKQQH
ncbi:MAG: hypothetical protein Fur0041_00620 [Bacteroidia bacterium]